MSMRRTGFQFCVPFELFFLKLLPSNAQAFRAKIRLVSGSEWTTWLTGLRLAFRETNWGGSSLGTFWCGGTWRYHPKFILTEQKNTWKSIKIYKIRLMTMSPIDELHLLPPFLSLSLSLHCARVDYQRDVCVLRLSWLEMLHNFNRCRGTGSYTEWF